MTVNELYKLLENIIPKELSCEWDNDGKMCIPNGEKKVNKVLVALDCTENVISYAEKNNYDVILTHHPLVFHPLCGIDENENVSRKIIRLIKSDIAVMSFHTRLDAVENGVNSELCRVIGAVEEGMFFEVGRVGVLKKEIKLEDFMRKIKEKLECDFIQYCHGAEAVKKIGVIGGSGKGCLDEANSLGCDTVLTGEMSHDSFVTASEMGINLVCVGHHSSENIVCSVLCDFVKKQDGDIYCEIFDSKPVFTF